VLDQGELSTSGSSRFLPGKEPR